MAITFITGKPGGGKGLVSMQQVVDELRLGKRCIITNLAIHVEPWVNSRLQPMCGLAAFLQRSFGSDFDVRKRVFVLSDDDIESFFLWRAVKVGDKWELKRAEPEVLVKGGEERVMGFDASLGMSSGGVLYIVDEAWHFYSSRRWQRTGEGLQFYNAQNRKFGDDVFIVTQHTKQIDPAIIRVAQDFWVVRNHGMMSIGLFRQPDVFSVRIYDSAPTGGQLSPMSTKLFRLDAAGLGQTYDTSAGVGLAVRSGADIGRRRRGLPWWGIPATVVFLACFTWYATVKAGWLFGHAVMPKGMAAARAVVSDRSSVSGGGEHSGGVSESAAGGKSERLSARVDRENDVFCKGWCLLDNEITVFLSDGRTAYSVDGDVQEVRLHWVRCFGRKFDVRCVSSDLDSGAGVVSMNPVAGAGEWLRPASSVVGGSVDSRPSVSVSVIGQAYLARTPASVAGRVSGFANVGQGLQSGPAARIAGGAESLPYPGIGFTP
jgi:hypothetical protein